MVRSMTGYGKAEAMLETGKITVEVRSLNGKTADISIKTTMLPKDKEMTVRQKIAAALTRGNIDFFINYEANAADGAKKINMDMAMEYYRQISALGEKIGIDTLQAQNPNDLIATILRMPEVMDVKKQDVITDENWPLIESCIDQALENINTFRAQEGEVLYKVGHGEMLDVFFSADFQIQGMLSRSNPRETVCPGGDISERFA